MGMPSPRVVAIVAAYNEAARIRPVLEVLTHTPEINRIIVVDDGSSDGTAAVASAVSGVCVLRNEHNAGKAASLERGVRASNEPIIFFCDADLVGLTPHIVSEIVSPVARGEKDMCIGIRDNLSQKTFLPFALNSGERALRRELWELVPAFFKHRYRIEVGLNTAALFGSHGLGWQRFGYYQTFKESKYGLWRGFFLRVWMSCDVVVAYLYALFIIGMRGKPRTLHD